ncbi:MAG: hypothetical protein MUF54_18115 [Polyangiaceae bacterium]|jgi:hypothetical protein|nr:hypothetical protein [Polyangiaceae bacterium]
MFIKLAKLRALPSCGVADSMMSVSEREASSLASFERSDIALPRSATLCASSTTITSQ